MIEDPWRGVPKRDYLARDPAITSRMMAKVKNKNSRAEVLLRRALWRRGLRYVLHQASLAGKPDIVFRGPKVVVFVDGDFWHGRAIREQGRDAFAATLRTERRDWWIEKIQRTVERDDSVTSLLEREGWRVLRLWESQVLRDTENSAQTVVEFLRGDGKPHI